MIIRTVTMSATGVLLAMAGLMTPIGPAAADTAGFGGKDYTAEWRVFNKSFIQANVDSRGKVSIKNSADRSVFAFGLQGMERDFWKTSEVVNATAVLDDSTIIPGKTGNGFRFDRFPIDLGASVQYRFSGSMSIAAWVKPEILGGFIVANGFTKHPNFFGEDHLYSLEIQSDGSLWFELTDIAGKRHFYSPPDLKLTTNAWQHVAATYDGAVMRVYIDGKEAGSGKEDKNIRIRDAFPEGRPLRLGDGARAVMDDFRLYGRGLTAREVKALADGAALTPADGNLEQGLAARWDFDAKQGAFWNVNCKEAFTIKGVTLGGTEVAIAMTLSVSGDTLQCRYEASAPITLVGMFPGVPEANWFRSKNGNGKDIQGELWGTFTNLDLFGFLEYNHLERRTRLAFGEGQPLTVKPCGSPTQPPAFTLASARKGDTNVIDFTFQSLDPAKAPLAAADVPVVTRPFDRKKLKVREPAVPVKIVALRGEPVFKRGEKLAFRLTLNDATLKAIAGRTPEVRCIDAMTEAVMEKLALGDPSEGIREITLQEVKQGPYRVELWNGDNKLGESEFVVVGPIEQRKIGPLEKAPLKLREVDKIECAEDNGKHEFYALSPDRVKINEAPGVGKFLVYDALPSTEERGMGHEWIAYRVNHLKVDKPHLLVVEYPDIGDTVVCITIMHALAGDAPKDANGNRVVTLQNVLDYAKARNWGPQDNYRVPATCGYVSGNGFHVSGKTQSFSTVFYPGDEFAVIQFDNFGYINRSPVRLSRIAVYEIEDDLPMVAAPNLANDRIFGHYDEWIRDPTKNFASVAMVRGEMHSLGVPNHGYANKYYKWYYVAAERLVKYLRFRGENTWFGGVIRYGSATFPSETAYGGGPDMMPLYARMFEENNLTLVPSVGCMSTFPVRLLDRHSSYDVQRGADTSLQVSWYGDFSYVIWGKGRAVNPLHPAVREAFGAQAAELARVYKDYPAVKGVLYLNTLANGYLYPSYFGSYFHCATPPGYDFDESSSRYTFDDRTIAEFEKRTGIKVPAEGEKRFKQRRQWLMANARDAWNDFRCRLIAEAYQALAEPVKKECPRMEFFTGEIGNTSMTVAYAGGPDEWSSLDLLRKMGSHLTVTNAYDYVPGYFFGEMNGGSALYNGTLKSNRVARFNAMNVDRSTDGILDGQDRVGAYLGRTFYEAWSRPYPPERPWYTSKVHSCRYPLAGNRGSMLDFAVILSRCTPVYICHCWVDGNVPQGHDEQFREFTSAYRSIPLGKYRTVFAERYPGITVRSAGVSGKTHFYAVNTDSKTRMVKVKTTKGIKERTVGYPKPVQTGGGWQIDLEPYAVRVFELTGGKLGEITAK
ncbi:MAG: LamG domain-containing protein [Kiritimatiellae bacterium]|nr:LamG domain-containing protein [Kiritimatiellia bacterium]